jgi:hypothetical protein
MLRPQARFSSGRRVWRTRTLREAGLILFASATLLAATSTVASCVGDCNGDQHVAADELVTGVNIALDATSLNDCSSFDSDDNARVTVDELVTAVDNALTGCPATPTAGASATETPAPPPPTLSPTTVVPSPAITSITPNTANAGATISGFQVTGENLDGATFSFLPATAGISVDSVSINVGGTSATMNVNLPAGVVGDFVLVATAAQGQSDPAPSPANTLHVTIPPILIGGPPVTVSTQSAGQTAELAFTAEAGQAVSVTATDSTYSDCVDMSLLNPNGHTLATTTFCGTNAGLIDETILPESGTYVIVIDPQGTLTGSASITLYDATAATGTIDIGGPPALVITAPGQNAKLTFSGTASQAVSVTATNSSYPGCVDLSLLKPDDTVLSTAFFCNATTGLIEATTLPESGAYTVVIDPRGPLVGTAQITLYDATELKRAIAVDGPAIPVTTVPGQKAALTFSATMGQSISVTTSNSSYPGCVDLLLLRPDDSVLATTFYCGANAGLIEGTVLPESGTYTIVIDPRGPLAGGVQVTLYDTTEVTATIVIGGPAVTVSTVPGQNAALTFSGTAGQTVSVTTANSSYPGCVDLSLLNPHDSVLATTSFCGTDSGMIAGTVLPESGTYTIVVDPQETLAGSVQVSVAGS